MNEQTKVLPVTPEITATSQDFTTLNISGQNSTSRWGEAETHRQHMQSGAKWFYWIAGLSLINSVAALSNSNWSFLAGLGITQFISGFALGLSEDLGGAVTVIALILDILVAAFFVFLGVFATKGHTWAFVLGLAIYVLDGLIFLRFSCGSHWRFTSSLSIAFIEDSPRTGSLNFWRPKLPKLSLVLRDRAMACMLSLEV